MFPLYFQNYFCGDLKSHKDLDKISQLFSFQIFFAQEQSGSSFQKNKDSFALYI